MPDIELFFSTPHPDYYLIALGVSALLCALWFVRRAAKKGVSPAASLTALGLGALLGALAARALYLLVEVGDTQLMAEMFFAPEDVREFGFAGALLGMLLGGCLAEKMFKAKGLLNALAAPGLMMIALARLAECFVPFGSGKYMEAGALQFFPLSMPDGYGEWMLSVWLLEALWALGSLFYLLKRKNAPSPADMLLALTLYHGGQIYLESLRAESLSYGFIRVSQLLAAVMLFLVLLRCAGQLRERKNDLGKRIGMYLVCVALYIAAEFALDRLTWPDIIVRLLMVPLTLFVLWTVLGAVFAVEKQRLASGKEES